jgi:DNA-binding NtrC family response regulator
MRDPSRPAFCLLIEDDPLVGLDLAEALDAAGFYVAGPFRSGREAARWLERFTPDVAVVDLALSDGPCRDLVRALRARGIPFLVHSGGRRGEGPIPAHPDEPWFEKPASAAAIAGALHRLLAAPRGIAGATPLAALQQR